MHYVILHYMCKTRLENDAFRRKSWKTKYDKKAVMSREIITSLFRERKTIVQEYIEE